MDISIIQYIINFLIGKDCLNTRNGIAYTNKDTHQVESKRERRIDIYPLLNYLSIVENDPIILFQR